MPTGSDAALAAEPKSEAGARAKAADLVAPAAPSASSGPPQAKDRIARADADASDELKEERDARARTGNAAVPAPIGRVVAREGSSIAPLSEQVTTAAGLVVHAPDARVKWRVMASRIERSVDGGLTWAAESSPAAADLKMGAAPSAGVCWLASPAGQVLRRAETGVWTDVSPAPRVAVATLAVSNAASAVIASPDGTRLRTTDAGRTWVADTER
jgi:hypothetical protein